MPLPIEGDQTVQLFATWNHTTEVWATDSQGQIFYELLGAAQMTEGVDAQCALNRHLVADEYILPIDVNTGERPWLATKVGGTPPQNCMPCAEALQTAGFVYDHSYSTCEWNGLPQNCIWGAEWIWSDDCGGVQYGTNEKRWYTFTVACQTTITAVLTPTAGNDPQIALVNCCPTLDGEEDMLECCVSTADIGINGDPETIIEAVAPGTYWVSVAMWDGCGSYDLHVTSADCPLGPSPPSDQTIHYDPTSGDVELRWTETGAPYYNIYRGTADPYSGLTFLGSVPAGVGFYSDFACANTQAFYYVTSAYDILQSAPNRPLQVEMNAKGEKKESFDALQPAPHRPPQTEMKARRDDKSLLRRIQ